MLILSYMLISVKNLEVNKYATVRKRVVFNEQNKELTIHLNKNAN